MSAPNLSDQVKKTLNALNHLNNRILPTKVGTEAVNMFKDNIQNSSFFGQPYREVIRNKMSFRGTRYKPLLSHDNHLQRAIDYETRPGQVIIRNPVHYASIHNDGGSITVTISMKKHFWKAYYDTIGQLAKNKKGILRKNKRNQAISSEAQFYHAMALKKVGSKINMPQRKFIGSHIKVTRMLNDIINKELQNIIQKWKNS